MPQTASAKKALRQNKKLQAHNRTYKNRIKKLSRQILDLLKENKQKEASELLPTYYKAVDKAVKRNILPKNTAARRKSVLTKKIAGVSKKETAQEETIAAESSSQAS